MSFHLGRPAFRLSPGFAGKQGGAGLAQAYLDRMTGAEFGFSDLSRLFVTYQGAANVAAPGDPIGLIVSREKQGTKTLLQTMTGQAEMLVNGGFDSDTVWTKNTGWTIAGGKATKAPGVVANLAQTVVPPPVNTLLRGTMDIVDFAASGLRPLTMLSGVNVMLTAAAVGSYSWLSPYVTGNIYYLNADATFSGSVDNASMKTVPHRYGIQPTGGSRGTWQAGGILRVATDDAYPTAILPGKLLMVRVKLTGGSGMRAVAGASGNATGRFNLYFNASGQAACRVGDGAEQAAGPDRTNVDGTIGLRRRDDNTIDLVIDGVVVNSAAMSGTPTTTQPLSIGAINNNGTPTSYMFGDFITGGKGDAIIAGDIAPTDPELLALHNYLMAA